VIPRRRFLSSLALPLVAACGPLRPAAAVREFSLVARPGEALADSGKPIPAWTYGGSVPGPQLRVRQGERVRVLVENRLPQPTTVHFHGVRLPNAMDGVPHLTQHPIAPGARFTYEFDAVDAGTYWYHSHEQSAEQLERGLYGSFVVEEREPPAVHRDLTWVLDDWRITAEGRLAEAFNNAHDMSHAGRIGNVITVNGSVQERFAVRAGERLRLRLVNAANARIFALRFTGHRPVVIAVDGQPVPPHEPVDARVVVAPGMRCDVVLDATGAPGARYDVQDLFYPREQYVLMELAYEQQPRIADTLPPLQALPPNPLAEPDLQVAGEHEIVFAGGMMGTMHEALLDGRRTDLRGLLRQGKAWAINGHVAHGHAMQPMLKLARGRSYVLRMVNDTRWHHPIHLHGHTFRVLRRNGVPTPHREWQDTVLMAPNERVDIAFVADNPGGWMFHCHILEHQDGGMMGVIEVA
jgi:FtsP/CotA-like multicopper oxidase with cupredoxin domain